MRKSWLIALLLCLFGNSTLALAQDPFSGPNLRSELKKMGIDSSNLLKVGDRAADFSLPSARGGSISLKDLRQKGPVIVTFYRGNWCPYCNGAMKELQSAWPQFQALGASLVAISPQSIAQTQAMQKKYNLPFAVASDPGQKTARQYGLVYTVPEAYLKKLRGFFVELKDYNGGRGNELPLTATYIVTQDGRIAYAFIDPNYKLRAKPATLLKVLQRLAR